MEYISTPLQDGAKINNLQFEFFNSHLMKFAFPGACCLTGMIHFSKNICMIYPRVIAYYCSDLVKACFHTLAFAR